MEMGLAGPRGAGPVRGPALSLGTGAQAKSYSKVRFSVEVGATFLPAHTASGRLLLAYFGDDEKCAATITKALGLQQ